jgi:hypothetical protein
MLTSETSPRRGSLDVKGSEHDSTTCNESDDAPRTKEKSSITDLSAKKRARADGSAQT